MSATRYGLEMTASMPRLSAVCGSIAAPQPVAKNQADSRPALPNLFGQLPAIHTRTHADIG